MQNNSLQRFTMEKRKSQLVSNFNKLELECSTLIRVIHVLLQKNSDAVQQVTCMGAEELMLKKNFFLKVFQDVSNNIQKVLAMNVELEIYSEDDDVPPDSSVLALDYNTVSVRTDDVSLQKINDAKLVKKAIEQQKTLTLIPDLMLKVANSNTTSVDSDLKSNPRIQELSDVEELPTKEIQNAIAPKCNDQCLLSIYSSPSHFYINLCNAETSIIDFLANQLTELGNSNTRKFSSKHEARERITKYCMAYCESWKSWYRAEIVDWLDMYKGDMVSIMLIDYGELKQAHCADIQPLPLTFYKYPKLAVKCHFAYLYPPDSTPNNVLRRWPKKSFAVLEKASTNKMYLLTYVEKMGDSYGIDLIESDNMTDDSLGQRMLNLKLAVEIIPASKLSTNPGQSSFIRKQIEKAQSNDGITNVEEFDSMEKAVAGYEATDEKRICRFTSNGTCFKVDCKLEHTELRKDGITTDKKKVFTGDVTSIRFPQVGEIVDIKITYIVSLKTFYAHLQPQDENSDRLNHLIMSMNDPERIKTYEKFGILPASGEMVLAKYWNNKWYRCLVKSVDSVTETLEPQILVFFVDFGDVMSVPLSNIREMLEEFMNLPFQAVKCNLAYIKPLKTMPNDWCKRYMESNYLSKLLQAEIIYAGADVLEVIVFESGMNIGTDLVVNELAEIQTELLLPAQDESIFLE